MILVWNKDKVSNLFNQILDLIVISPTNKTDHEKDNIRINVRISREQIFRRNKV